MSAPRQDQVHQAKATSAYVIAYTTDNSYKIPLILLGKKKVVCYQAQQFLELESNSAQAQQLRNNLLKKNLQECYQTRCSGMFFYGGGRPTFLGGRLNHGEAEKTAAAREFLEELGIIHHLSNYSEHEKKQFILLLKEEIINNLQEIHRTNQFRGVYFCLNVDVCPMLKSCFSQNLIKFENNRIKESDAKLKLVLKKRLEANLAAHISELQELAWIMLPDLSRHLKELPIQDIKIELEKGSQFLIYNFLHKDPGIVEDKNLYERFLAFLAEKTSGESLQANFDAANEFQRQITSAQANTLTPGFQSQFYASANTAKSQSPTSDKTDVPSRSSLKK